MRRALDARFLRSFPAGRERPLRQRRLALSLTAWTSLQFCLLVACSRSSEPPAARAELSPAAARAWQSACASCHARPGTGAPLAGDATAWAERRAQGADVLLAHTVNGYKGMPPLGSCMDCSEQDFEALIRFMSGT